MPTTGKSAAASHVGKIRANNQDSGYAGTRLFVVADGMGGHAGGDVASAVALRRVIETDTDYASAHDAQYALQSAFVAANSLLAQTVFEHPELMGMGTTVSAILKVGDDVAIAHIGDSRIYLLRDGELTQISADHTFVQRLVDSGRITPEEAAVHPRRSVLMRVLGDVDATPEIDTTVQSVQPGDRWLLCSDGLSSYVADDKIRGVLQSAASAQDAAQQLVEESLSVGAPDNVTVVVDDIDETGDSGSTPPAIVGSAAQPLSFESDASRRSLRLPTLLLHPLKVTLQEDSHFEPESDEYLSELIEEDRRRAKRRRIGWLIGIALSIIAIVVALVFGYRWTQTHYYVGADGQTVVIFQGVQQNIGPISLHSVYEETSLRLDTLPAYWRDSVVNTISADNLADAKAILDRLRNSAND